MELKDILDRQAVGFVHNMNSKKRLLQHIAEQAHQVYGLNGDVVFDSLTKREHLGSTGVGRGVAIPHARFAELNTVCGLFTRLQGATKYDSMDGEPVDLVFTLLAPQSEGAEHLKALALVSRTLRARDICEKLRSNDDRGVLYDILTDVIRHEAA